MAKGQNLNNISTQLQASIYGNHVHKSSFFITIFLPDASSMVVVDLTVAKISLEVSKLR